MKLSDQQFQIVHEVFQSNNAFGYTETLMDIYEGFLASSNDDLGRMSQDYTTNCFHLLRQVCKLLVAIEPNGGFEPGKESAC